MVLYINRENYLSLTRIVYKCVQHTRARKSSLARKSLEKGLHALVGNVYEMLYSNIRHPSPQTLDYHTETFAIYIRRL